MTNGVAWGPVSHGVSPKGVFKFGQRDKSRYEFFKKIIRKFFIIKIKNFYRHKYRTICSASKPVEVFMGSETNNVIDRLFDTT